MSGKDGKIFPNFSTYKETLDKLNKFDKSKLKLRLI